MLGSCSEICRSTDVQICMYKGKVVYMYLSTVQDLDIGIGVCICSYIHIYMYMHIHMYQYSLEGYTCLNTACNFSLELSGGAVPEVARV